MFSLTNPHFRLNVFSLALFKFMSVSIRHSPSFLYVRSHGNSGQGPSSASEVEMLGCRMDTLVIEGIQIARS